MYSLGTRTIGKAVFIPVDVLTESVVGKVYGIKIQTKGVSNLQALTKILNKDLMEKFNAKLLYVEIDNSNILTIELEGSPFLWAALLAFLPQILAGLGIIIGLVLVYTIATSVPIWVYGLGALALLLVIFSTPISAPFMKIGLYKGAGR